MIKMDLNLFGTMEEDASNNPHFTPVDEGAEHFQERHL